MPLVRSKIKKILIIRFSSIGDIVLTSPVIRCLKLQLGAEIHFITKKAYKSSLIANPYIDQLITIHSKVSEVIQLLKQEQYDYLIDLHNNLRSQQIKLQLSVKSYSFNKINLPKWLMVRFKINRLPNVHIVDRYMETVKSLSVTNDGMGLDYFIPKEDELDVATIYADRDDISLKSGYIAFVIGATYATKRLPNEQIIKIIEQLNDPVILLGGPDDQANGAAIVATARKPVINACGVYNLNQSASIVRQATRVISHDTGLMHIAAAFQQKIISVWGNTIPEFGMYPYYQNNVDKNISFEQKGISCRPCSKLGHHTCPKGHFKCMQEIDIEGIAKAASLDDVNMT